MTVDTPYHCFGYGTKGHFYGINLFSALSKEGEWYLNRRRRILYVYPFKGQEFFTISRASHIIELEGCKNIRFENIIFDQSQKTPIRLSDCDNIHFNNCCIQNTSAWALIGKNCRNTVIENCHIHQTGGGGISLDGGDRNTLFPSGNRIIHNRIHDLGYWHKVYTPGIRVSGVGCLVSRNFIYNAPSLGILFHGNNHIIEKNELYNTCYESNDCGAIYAGKDWTCRGNIIRYNYFHDMTGYNNNGCIALYFDDGFSSADVYKNIFVRIKSGILIGGGRDFHIHDNTFVQCSGGITVDDRFDNWASHSLPIMQKYLHAVDYQSDIWKNAYPKLASILSENYFLPEGNVIEDNISIGANCLSLSGKSANCVLSRNNIHLPELGKANHENTKKQD